MRDKTETEIQAEIREYLQLSGWLVYRMNSGGRRGRVTLHPAGTPDLLALKNGRVVWIEVKKPGEKPSNIQLEVHDLLIENRFEVIIATSIDDVERL